MSPGDSKTRSVTPKDLPPRNGVRGGRGGTGAAGDREPTVERCTSQRLPLRLHQLLLFAVLLSLLRLVGGAVRSGVRRARLLPSGGGGLPGLLRDPGRLSRLLADPAQRLGDYLLGGRLDRRTKNEEPQRSQGSQTGNPGDHRLVEPGRKGGVLDHRSVDADSRSGRQASGCRTEPVMTHGPGRDGGVHLDRMQRERPGQRRAAPGPVQRADRHTHERGGARCDLHLFRAEAERDGRVGVPPVEDQRHRTVTAVVDREGVPGPASAM